MTKILMVCLGNICRSPLAEGILKSKVDPSKVYIDSAGTAGYHVGNPPDPRSIQIARKFGIDITEQRCRRFEAEDFLIFDHIYVMDKSNYSNVISLAPSADHKNKVKLLLEESDQDFLEVPDPYYDAIDGFETVFSLIDSACNTIALKFSRHE